jgi:preprotein translocase subunit SecD
MIRFEIWKIGAVFGICLLGGLFAMPNFFPEATVRAWPSYLPKSRIKLGFDITGGLETVYEADRASVREAITKVVRERGRNELRRAKIGYYSIGASHDGVRISLRNPGMENAAVFALLPMIGTPDRPAARIIIEGKDTILVVPTEVTVQLALAAGMESRANQIQRDFGWLKVDVTRLSTETFRVRVPGIHSFEDLKRRLEFLSRV